MEIHFLCCAHDRKRTPSHDVLRDVFSTIVKNVRGPPLSLFDMLLATRGVWELDVPLIELLLS